MGFKANQSEAVQGNSIKPEGDYECIIQNIEERTNKNNKTWLNIAMVIRNDIQQNYKNAYIFHTLWKRKEPTEADKQVNGYGFGQVMALGKAAGLPDGKEYDSLQQFCEELVSKPLRVTLKHEEYNGKTQERVSWLNPTKFPEVNHISKPKTVSNDTYANQNQSFASSTSTAQQGFTDMPLDDDIPF